MIETQSKQVDKKGIIAFIAITFGFTWPLLFVLWMRNLSLVDKHPLYASMPLSLAMFTPAISAYIVREYISPEDQDNAGLKVGEWKYYLQSYFAFPILFGVVYTLTALFVSAPEPNTLHSGVWGEIKINASLGKFAYIAILMSLTTGPITNGLHAFGQEFGWRGYLLQKLLPLGKRNALIISSAVAGVWYGPFVFLGLHFADKSLAGVLMFATLITLLGICLGHLRLISGSLLVTSFAHGVFNAQFYGAWSVLFPDINHYTGGITGIPGILVFLVLAVIVLLKNKQQ